MFKHVQTTYKTALWHNLEARISKKTLLFVQFDWVVLIIM